MLVLYYPPLSFLCGTLLTSPPNKTKNYVPISINLGPSDGAKDNVLIYVESPSKFCDLVLVDKDDFIVLPYISDPNRVLHEFCQSSNKREAAVATKTTENLSMTEEWLNSAHLMPGEFSSSSFSPPFQSFLIARALTSRQQRTLMMICTSSSWPA